MYCWDCCRVSIRIDLVFGHKLCIRALFIWLYFENVSQNFMSLSQFL